MAARIISPMVTSAGATPFIVNRSIPKGGVSVEAPKLISIIVQNQTGLSPRVLTTGIKMGTVINVIEMRSIKQPRTNTTICIAITISIGYVLRLAANLANPWVHPETAKIWQKATDPVIIIITIIVT